MDTNATTANLTSDGGVWLDEPTVALFLKYKEEARLLAQELEGEPPRYYLPFGVHRGIPAEIYQALPCVRATYLEDIAISCPEYCKYRIDNPDEESEALIFGTAWHTAFLEPDLFPKNYVLWKGGRRAGGKWEDFKRANSDHVILKEEDYDKCLAMAKRLRKNPQIVRLFERGSETEATLIWRDKQTGLACKVRVDALIEDEAPTMGDLKSTVSAHPEAFKHKSLLQFGYDVQGGFYSIGVYALLNPKIPPNFCIAASEKKAPHLCSFFEVPPRTLRVGWIRARKALDIYAQCVKTGVWPGYSEEIIPMDAPEWHLKQYEGAR